VQQQSPLDLLREFADIDKRRKTCGVTPLEYLRWQDLKSQLDAMRSRRSQPMAPKKQAAPRAGDTMTRLVVEFRSAERLSRAWMHNVNGAGVFVSTPFTPEVGEEFRFLFVLKDSGESFEVPGVVVSNSVANGFSTNSLGMGVRLKPIGPQDRDALEALVALATGEAG